MSNNNPLSIEQTVVIRNHIFHLALMEGCRKLYSSPFERGSKSLLYQPKPILWGSCEHVDTIWFIILYMPIEVTYAHDTGINFWIMICR